MPWRDWQFWVVTGVAAIALVMVWRAVRPPKRQRGRRVKLTIERSSAPGKAGPDESRDGE